MLRYKKIYVTIIVIFTGSLLLYISYSVLYGINSSFTISNGYLEQELIGEIVSLDSLSNQQWIEAFNRELRPIDVMVKVNKKVTYKGLVSFDALEPTYFTENLKFGNNRIQIYSNELNSYVELSKNIYVGQHFDIVVSSAVEYFKGGEYVDLDRIGNLIESGKLDDYSIKDHDEIFYDGFFIHNSAKLSIGF